MRRLVDTDPRPVVEAYSLVLAGAGSAQAIGNVGGFSGSRLWRITAANGGSYCLRRWPVEHPTADRLAFIHDVLLHVGASLPVVAQPIRTNRGETFLRHLGHFWELTSWLPGKAAEETPARTEQACAAMRMLARFHAIASEFRSTLGPAPAIADRLRLFAASSGSELTAFEQAMRCPLDAELHVRCHKLLSAARLLLGRDDLVATLTQTKSVHLIPAIRDIHREHVLFDGNEVTGLIDFGALRLDTPLTDIARLLGSLVGDEVNARNRAMDAYAEIRELSDLDRKLVEVLDASGLLGAALNWLRWLYLENRSMGPQAVVKERLEGILRRLDALH